MPRCPQCGSWRTAPSRRYGVAERIAALVLLRPFSCRQCTRRFLVFDLFELFERRG